MRESWLEQKHQLPVWKHCICCYIVFCSFILLLEDFFNQYFLWSDGYTEPHHCCITETRCASSFKNVFRNVKNAFVSTNENGVVGECPFILIFFFSYNEGAKHHTSKIRNSPLKWSLCEIIQVYIRCLQGF